MVGIVYFTIIIIFYGMYFYFSCVGIHFIIGITSFTPPLSRYREREI